MCRYVSFCIGKDIRYFVYIKIFRILLIMRLLLRLACSFLVVLDRLFCIRCGNDFFKLAGKDVIFQIFNEKKVKCVSISLQPSFNTHAGM